MITEICTASFDSAMNAGNAGGDRIELCSELLLGGVTPSYGLVKKVLEQLQLPVYVLVRPRSGNFTYSREELDIMREDIAVFAELGCAGIVSGVLKKDHRVDTLATAVLKEAAGDLDFTFHRAFDWVPDQEEAVEQLLQIGCKRILSSGGGRNVDEGFERLVTLNRKYGDRLTLMPGGGVNESNISRFKMAGFREIHFSASGATDSGLPRPRISFYPEQLPDERKVYVSDPEVIKRMVKMVK